MGKNSSWLYIGSVLLVIVAIAVTAVLDRNKNQQEDIRAKASVTTGQAATAIVSSVNESSGTLLVTSLIIGSLSDNTKPNQLTWTITVPGNFNTGSVGQGSRVSLKLIPSTVNIQLRSATALEVKAL